MAGAGDLHMQGQLLVLSRRVLKLGDETGSWVAHSQLTQLAACQVPHAAVFAGAPDLRCSSHQQMNIILNSLTVSWPQLFAGMQHTCNCRLQTL